jgi:hypothetical protein
LRDKSGYTAHDFPKMRERKIFSFRMLIFAVICVERNDLILPENRRLIEKTIQRARVPGQSTEMLGALFGGRTDSAPRAATTTFRTTDSKVAELQRLHERGNLSKEEFMLAEARLRTGREIEVKKNPISGSVLETVVNAVGSDVWSLFEDPEVKRRREQERLSRRFPPTESHWLEKDTPKEGMRGSPLMGSHRADRIPPCAPVSAGSATDVFVSL